MNERLRTATWKSGHQCLSREIVEEEGECAKEVEADVLNAMAQAYFDARAARRPWARHVHVQRVTWGTASVARRIPRLERIGLLSGVAVVCVARPGDGC